VSRNDEEERACDAKEEKAAPGLFSPAQGVEDYAGEDA
jgi:hypothetical protein